MKSRSLMTVAGGLPVFFRMAINLAYSFERWHTTDDLKLFIITDLPCTLPNSLRRTQVLRIAPGSLPAGFSAKLLLDRFLQTDTCLFLDADCLVMGNLNALFEAFDGLPVGVLGEQITDGEWFGDVASLRRRFNLPFLPKFNGGVYYLTASDQARQIYDFAREIEPRYDEFGCVRLRGQRNEEILMAISLAKHGLEPVRNSGNYYADFQWWPQLQELKVLTGRCRMKNPPPPDPRHQARYPAFLAEPLVLHFLGHHVESPEYREAAMALKLSSQGLPFAALSAWVIFSPLYVARACKNRLRPVWHKVFGVRPIRKSRSRLVTD